jgi:hypothetical protein
MDRCPKQTQQVGCRFRQPGIDVHSGQEISTGAAGVVSWYGFWRW